LNDNDSHYVFGGYAVAIQFALGEVFIENRIQLRQMAMSIVRTADLADDIMQDAYVRLADGGRLSGVQKPLFYCHRVVRNLAMDHFRRHVTEASHRTFGLDVETLERPCRVTPDKSLNDKRLLAAIGNVLNGLPVRTQRAFELHRLDEMTQREVAACLNCSATLVNFMIRDAVDALQECRVLLDG
jgi:RNA polymerase sigma factor (sigma-70 family)